MQAINEYKEMVVALSNSGVDLPKALDAAEMVLFGKADLTAKPKIEVVIKDPEPTYKREKAERLSITDRENDVLIDQTIIAERIGVSTRELNEMLRGKDLLYRHKLDDKPMPKGVTHRTTNRLTPKGERFGKGYVHQRFSDGTPAVWRFKWYPSVIKYLASN